MQTTTWQYEWNLKSWSPSDKDARTAEALLTWVEERVHTDLPRSHEPADLLQISSSHDVLEDDVIGEVHSPLCRCNRYDRRALRGAAPRAFALWGDVRRRAPVGGRVVWRRVMRRAVLTGGVLGRGRGRGRVVRRCIVRGAVVGWCVVRWGVLWRACVRWHRYVVVVLHPCGVVCLPLCCLPGKTESRNPSKRTNKIAISSLPPRAYYPLRFQLEGLLHADTSQILCVSLLCSF